MGLEPLGDRLIVRPISEDEERDSGLVIPDMAKEKPQRGKVLAVGEGRTEFVPNGGAGGAGSHWVQEPLKVAVGDVVLYSLYGGTELQVDGEKVLVLRETDVLAKETEDVGI